MNVAIDARELLGRPTGVGRYLSHLLTTWSALERARAHQLVLYAPGPVPEAAWRPEWSASARVASGSSGTWWEQVTFPAALRHDRPDVVFCPAYTAPLATGRPVVVTVHDVSFAAHPEWFGFREGLRRRVLTRRSAGRARLVLTDSEFSAQEIVSRLGVPSTRVRVVPLGVLPPSPGPVPDGGETGDPLVLYAGSIFNRRHVPDLLRALRRLLDGGTRARLEIVGENRTHPHQDLDSLVRDLALAGQVRLRSYVPDAELARLYGRARVFVFLSEYEGFGLTPLEALAAGVPVVVLDTAAAREMYGEAATYVAKGDVGATAEAIRSLLQDAGARGRVLGAAAPLLRRYSWEEAARRTLDALEEAASPPFDAWGLP